MIPGRRYTPSAIWWIVRHRKWLLIAPFMICLSLAAVLASQLKDRYRAQTLILVVPQRIPENYVRPAISDSIQQRLESISPQIMSESRLERIINELDLYPERRALRGGLEDIVAQMRNDTSVDVIKGDLFRVSYTGDDPYKVMQVTQRLASLFVEENLKDREQLVNGTNQFLESQLDRARQQLQEQERKLQEYRERHAGELPSQVGSNLQALQTSAFQLQGIEESISRDRDRHLELERTLADLVAEAAKPAKTPASAVAPSSSADNSAPPSDGSDLEAAATGLGGDLATRLAELQKLQETLQALELRLKPDHPDVIRTKRLIQLLQLSLERDRKDRLPGEAPLDPAIIARRDRIAQVRSQIAALDKEIALKTADSDRLKSVMGTYQSRVDSEPERESELIALTRDYDTLRANYQNLLAKRQEAGIAANLEQQQGSQQFRTLDPAKLPEKPYGPNRTAIKAVGGLLGLTFGFGLTILLELRDQTFRHAQEVLPTLSLPVLASVPVIVTTSDRRRAKALAISVAFLALTAIVSGAILAHRAGVLNWKWR
jgi:polysaccharide chain length determinant protein (PEP-CTERM system associated)